MSSFKMQGFTLWFTGLPCSGKTTIADVVDKELQGRGLKVESLDGDEIRRMGFIAKLLSRNDVVTLGAFVSPYNEVREHMRSEIDTFIEVYVRCPVEVCIERDVKGMYKKALAGEIQNFTGVSDPYEVPVNPEIVVDTDKETVEESVAKVLEKLEELGRIPGMSESVPYADEDEEKTRKQLEYKGYL